MTDTVNLKEPLDDETIRRALDHCAQEPVHIPGHVQPFSCLLAIAPDGRITHASDNAAAAIGRAAVAALGADAPDVLGREAWHAVRNRAAETDAAEQAALLGAFEVGGEVRAVSAFRSGDRFVVEIEPEGDGPLSEVGTMPTLVSLLNTIEACGAERSLLELTPRLLRHVTGYDRVMVYRFDRDFNGEVVAEDRRPDLEPFLGLRFPSWDIPAQAREIMRRLPLRFISDVDQEPSPIRAVQTETAPLDITFAACRGVSPVHMEYLRNMGARATMTLSIVQDGRLWGMISLHHSSPRVPSPDLRQILTSFNSMFALKLQALLQRRHIELVGEVDEMRSGAFEAIGDEDGAREIADLVRRLIGADGVAISVGDKLKVVGRVPDPALTHAVLDFGHERPGAAVAIENLSETFPDLTEARGDLAGALTVSTGRDRVLAVFRGEILRTVEWAGAPEKNIVIADGQARLTPRGSFAIYSEEKRGFCEPWSERDCFLAERIWTLVYEAERRELLHAMNRQQRIMIDELNHRVRNILTLIRSVSRQVRDGGGGSLEEYSQSLEARIQSLATSHDLISTAMNTAAPLRKLLTDELAPHAAEEDGRLVISCDPLAIEAEMAPILSLVIHELSTNAVKHGALSKPGGRVVIAAHEESENVVIRWREEGGPRVARPERRGFGTRLIEEAIPHEFKGATTLVFQPDGVTATLSIAASHFRPADRDADAGAVKTAPAAADAPVLGHVRRVLVMEDNFIIAEGVKAQLSGLGVGSVETVSNVDAGFEAVERDRPELAVLDVNLGGGRTSEAFALHLHALGLPFAFITGYGEGLEIDERLSAVPRLTKPVADSALATALADLTREMAE